MESLDLSSEADGRHYKKGRPKLCTPQVLHSIKSQIKVLREAMEMFTSNILRQKTGVNESNSTFRRFPYCMGYRYRRPRKKGMLTRHHKLKRFKFAKKVKRLFSLDDHGSSLLWTKGRSSYVGFAYKSNSYLHSKTPIAREW